MDINLFTVAMRAEFLKSMQAIPPQEPPWTKFTQIVPSTARIENYAWMTPSPGISRYLNHRRYAQLDQIKYTLPNLEFDGSILVSNRDVEDDQIGGYQLRFKELGEKARIFPWIQALKTLAAGKTTTCFDGTNFFASSHTLGGGNAAPNGFGGGLNYLTFTSANSSDAVVHRFVMLTHYGAIKPLLWQNRKGPELNTTAGTPQSKEAKKTAYFIDLEGTAGFGYWWDATLVEITNTPSIPDVQNCIDAVMKQVYTYSLPAALPTDPTLYVHSDLVLSPENSTIVCSTGLFPLMRHALMEERVGVSVAGSTGGITNNIYYGLFGLVATPYLN